MRLGVFGGTFNPIHLAHLRLAEEARCGLNLDRVLFLPAARPPLKDTDLAEGRDRLEMTRLAIEANPAFELDDLEFRREGPSYTVDTLRSLRAEHPGAELWFLLGADALADIGAWHAPDALFELANFAVFNRPGAPEQALEDFLPVALRPAFDAGEKGLVHRSGHELRWLAFRPLAISASEIRDAVSKGQSIRYLVPDGVAEYIADANLYRERH